MKNSNFLFRTYLLVSLGKFMKTTKLIRCVLFAFIIAAISLVGCEKSDSYDIGAPDNLNDIIDSVANIAVEQQRIADSIATADSLALEARLLDDLYQVGSTDNTTSWWTTFSKYYRLENNSDTVYLKFKNFTAGTYSYNTWLAAITTDDDRDNTNGVYGEYCIWRGDNYSNYAWSTLNDWNTSNDDDTHSEWQTTNYSTMATEDVDTDWSNYQNGADCSVMVTRGGDSVFVDVQMLALSGKLLTKSFFIVESGIKDQPVRFFMFSESGHLVFYKTLNEPMDIYAPTDELDPNWDSGEVEEIEDEDETTSVTYRVDVTATATSTDGTVLTETYFAEGISYSAYGTFLALEGGHLIMDPTETYYCALADIENSSAWYYPYSEETMVGLEDNSQGWWSEEVGYIAPTVQSVAIGEGYFHYKFDNYTAGTGNWQNWCLIVTNGYNTNSTNHKECFVLRSDSYGWGDYMNTDNITIDYPDTDGDGDAWNDFRSYMNGATVEIEVTVTAEGSEETSSVAIKPGQTL